MPELMRSTMRCIDLGPRERVAHDGTDTACSLPHDGQPHPAKLLATGAAPTDGYQAGPGLSGAWYDAARNGEGIILEVLPSGRALAIWLQDALRGVFSDEGWKQSGIMLVYPF